MKTFILRTVVISILLFAYKGIALGECRELNLSKIPQGYTTEEEQPNRVPSRPLSCIISEDGILIQGVDSCEIISYDIYDMEGSCLLTTNDSQEFISYVLSHDNTLEIRIETASYILKGILY